MLSLLQRSRVSDEPSHAGYIDTIIRAIAECTSDIVIQMDSDSTDHVGTEPPATDVSDIKDLEIPPSWTTVFKESVKDIERISKYLDGKVDEICPMPRNVYRAFWLTPLKCVKVVIVGQDPYHTVDNKYNPIADGLSFSTRKVAKQIPPSLKNIFAELVRSHKITMPDNGDLTEWAKKGILMLNMSLTTQKKMANAHKNVWDGLIYEVVSALVQLPVSPVFLLMGKNSQKILTLVKGSHIDSVCVVHPSPMANSRAGASGGFVGSGCFADVDRIVHSKGFPPINWQP